MVVEEKVRYQPAIQSSPAKVKVPAASPEVHCWRTEEQGFEEGAVAWVILAPSCPAHCHLHIYASCSSVVTAGRFALGLVRGEATGMG